MEGRGYCLIDGGQAALLLKFWKLPGPPLVTHSSGSWNPIHVDPIRIRLLGPRPRQKGPSIIGQSWPTGLRVCLPLMGQENEFKKQLLELSVVSEYR